MSAPKVYGLIGYPLSHSFSRQYFTQKFDRLGLHDHEYRLFPLPRIEAFRALCQDEAHLCGLNVTIPHKQAVIPFLDALDSRAERIGAVNTILFRGGQRTGYNTDYVGFRVSLLDFLGAVPPAACPALILGTGGAAQAVRVVLEDLGMPFVFASRSPKPPRVLAYSAVRLADFRLIINTTPLGMHPHIHQSPDIPYDQIGPHHLLFDLVYNPEETQFLTQGKSRGARTQNGLPMLHQQAEAAWEIWTTGGKY
ncbi:MAG: shikimate dehydrogenase family protein [Bernardetiaceae bacterium]